MSMRRKAGGSRTTLASKQQGRIMSAGILNYREKEKEVFVFDMKKKNTASPKRSSYKVRVV